MSVLASSLVWVCRILMQGQRASCQSDLSFFNVDFNIGVAPFPYFILGGVMLSSVFSMSECLHLVKVER